MNTWPLHRPLLIVDADPELATLWQTAISRRGGECRTLRSFRDALHTVIADPRPWIVLVGHSIVRTVPRDLLEDLRALTPGLTLIGTGQGNAHRAFTAVGIEDFVPLPWGSPERLGKMLFELTHTTDSIELGLLNLDHALDAFAAAA